MEEKEDVRQMDAVSQGILWGVVGSALVVLGGSIALTSNTFSSLTTGYGLFIWLLLISALCVFSFIHGFVITGYLLQTPRQSGTTVT